MDEQKEKLENELRFLRDTLEAGLISEDEFYREKERIEKKLGGITSEEPKKDVIPEAIKEDTSEGKPESVSSIQQKTYLDGASSEQEKSELVEASPAQEKAESVEVTPEQETPMESIDKIPESEKPVDEIEIESQYGQETPSHKNRWIKYSIIAIIIVGIFIAFSFINAKETKQPPTKEMELSENDVIKLKEDIEINMLIINDIDCTVCDTERIINIVKQLFPTTKETFLDIKNPEAKKIIEELEISALPAYIFDTSVENATNFNKFKSALIKYGDRYLISQIAAGSNYFFQRNSAPKSIELILLEDSPLNKKAIDNLKDFLVTFEDDVKYNEYVVKKNEKDTLREELSITTYPVCLINNQYKMVGIFSPETIKQNFCNENKLEQCNTILSKDIK